MTNSTVNKFFFIAMFFAGATMSLLAQPVITGEPTNFTVLIGGNAQFSVRVSGPGPFSYQWHLNGTNLPNNIINTVAGGGSGVPTNGVPATNLTLDFPNSAVADAAGNLVIANSDQVLKVSTNGLTSVLARGLDRTTGLAIDATGNIFIADYGAFNIDKINTNGILTRITNAQAADVAVDKSGNLYIAEYTATVVYKMDTNGVLTLFAGNGVSGYSGDGGAATNASLSLPQALAFDAAGNLFIADNDYVRRVDTRGIITTVAGGGLDDPGDGGMATNANLEYAISGVAVDAHENLFLTDYLVILEVNSEGVITTVAGNGLASYSGDGGAATNASLNDPQRVAVDAAGNLLIADSSNNRIREVALAGTPTRTLNQVTLANAGVYSVTVTSPAGSVTSSNAVLTVVVPPEISAAMAGNNSLSLSWNVQSNFTYQLQYTTNLAAPMWGNLGNPMPATNNTVSTVVTRGAVGQRFYRVQAIP